MPLPFPLDMWQHLCRFLATNPTCQVVIHQHQGRVCKVEYVLGKKQKKLDTAKRRRIDL